MDMGFYEEGYKAFKKSMDIRKELYGEFNSYVADSALNLSKSLYLLQSQLGPEKFLQKFPQEEDLTKYH